MARPLRRVIIGLSIRMGISPREIERWPMTDIRDVVATLQTMNRQPDSKPAPGQKPPPSDDDIKGSFSRLLAFKGD